MSIQHVVNLLLFIVGECLEHPSSGILALVIVALYNWRQKAVQHAEHEGQHKVQLRVSFAEKEKEKENRLWLERVLRSIRGEVTALAEQVDDRSTSSLVLPERRLFHVELTAIARSLTYLGSQIDSARVEYKDLDFYQKWVEELWARFRLFELNELKNNHLQRRLQCDLAGLRELYADIGEWYYRAWLSVPYRQFPGMLHILETMIDDGLPAEQIEPYILALSKQLTMLVVSFEKGVQEDGAPIWNSSIGKCKQLETLLESFEQNKP